MGCVTYFVLSNGKHPFGDRYDVACQNIIENEYTLDDLDGEEWPVAKDLINLMIKFDKSLRYNAKTLYHYNYTV